MGIDALKLPAMTDGDMTTTQKLQAIYEYMMQLQKMLKHALSTIDESNLSTEFKEQLSETAENAKKIESKVSEEAFNTYRVQTDKKIETKAEGVYIDPESGDEIELWTQILQTANEIALVVSGETAVGQVQTSGVGITAAGVSIKTGGTFTVDSGNFSLDGDGNLSASGANINGSLLNGGYPVLTPQDIYIGTAEPDSPKEGMVWICPEEEAGVVQTTLSWLYTQGSRQGLRSYPISATLTGPAAAANQNYQYDISIPVYLGGAVNNETVTIQFGGMTFTGQVSGSTYDHRTVEISAPGSAWIAADGSEAFTLQASSNYIMCNRAGSGYRISVVCRGEKKG